MTANKLAVGVSIITGAIFGAIAYRDATACKYPGEERLDGKTVVITGANSGLGKEVAYEFAKRGAKLFMACRDMEKCEEIRKQIVAYTYNERVYCQECDLANIKSIRTFAHKFNREEPSLHILVNNAGVMGIPEQTKTNDGLEMHFGVNYFGHFVLTNLLLDKLQSTGPCRVINVTCPHALEGKINFDDLNGEANYDPKVAYCQSKLAQILFTRELAKKLKDYCVSVNAISPGYSYTEIHRHMTYRTNHLIYHFAHPAMLILLKTPSQGAQTIIHGALTPAIGRITGKFFDNCEQVEPPAQALDDDVAKQLWEVSEKLMGPSPVQKKKVLQGKGFKIFKNAPEPKNGKDAEEDTDDTGAKDAAVAKNGKDAAAAKNGKNGKDAAGAKNGKNGKDAAAAKNGKNGKDAAGAKNGKNGKDAAGAKNGKSGKDAAGAKNGKNGKDAAGAKNGKNGKDAAGDKSGKNAKDAAKNGKNEKGASGAKNGKNGKDAAGAKNGKNEKDAKKQ